MNKPKLKLLVGSWHLLKQNMAFGNPTAGGFTSMAEALFRVAKLNDEDFLKERGIEFAVSAHWWHELIVPGSRSDVGYSAKWNNPRAIHLDQWADGYRGCHYAPIGRIIPPGFGLPGSDDGAFISPDPERRKLAQDMMVLSLETSDWVIREGLGEGNVIYWTGPDGLRWKRLVEGKDILLGHHLNPELQEWNLIVTGVGGALYQHLSVSPESLSKLLIEGKPAGDPCYLDVFTDTTLEAMGINHMNEVGCCSKKKVAEWQGEFCHSRGSGQTFSTAMQLAIAHGVFGGRIHLNSGGLGQVNFTNLLCEPGGTMMSLFPQYVDNDFLPGEGVPEWLADQIATIQLGAKWSAQTGQPFEVEFDARFCRYVDTIGALRKSALWVIDIFDAAVADLQGR